MGFGQFFGGTPGKFSQRSTLGPEQQQLYGQLRDAATQGSGGAFGQASNYYQNLLSNDSQDFDSFAAPEMRRFNQETIPGLAEQFAGMGSGSLSSSGFRNSAVNAGSDLSERLGAIRSGLRQQGAQGLMQLGQQGLGQYNENIYQPRTPGFFESIAPGVGKGIGNVVGGGLGSLFKGGVK